MRGCIAQWLERPPSKREVVGPTPITTRKARKRASGDGRVVKATVLRSVTKVRGFNSHSPQSTEMCETPYYGVKFYYL